MPTRAGVNDPSQALAESMTTRETAPAATRHTKRHSYEKLWRWSSWGVPLELFETATPEPTGTQVLLRVRAAGVCHSDLHIWEGSYDLGFGRELAEGQRHVRTIERSGMRPRAKS